MKVSTINISLIPCESLNHLMIQLCKRLLEIDIIPIVLGDGTIESGDVTIDLNQYDIENGPDISNLVEYVIQQIPFDFDSLPLLVEGESKIIRLLNSKIVIEKFKPTVYSYTYNRYGVVEGTDELRVLFTAAVFKKMNAFSKTNKVKLKNAFLAVIETSEGLLLIQEKVESCNLEIRVKRFHIGSPVHRYRYTEKYPTFQNDSLPLTKWTRFDKPIVCFDWRNPMTDENGARLADEPISDDYAGIWMNDISSAKKLASETFLWLEQIFSEADFLLIDICFFIDQSGTKLYGEISPDCMRVRNSLEALTNSTSFDKDLWRQGEKEQVLSERYRNIYNRIFNQTIKI